MKPDKPTVEERLTHILEAVTYIEDFTKDLSLNDFETDVKVYYACLYQFAVIGEAIINIGNEILDKYEYPWFKVRSFRNFIMHEYHAIDEQVVWDTIKLILPGFKEIMETIIDHEFDS
jgi:uncharacterized protein with HEPN domain